MASDQFVPGLSRTAPGLVHQFCDCTRRHHRTVDAVPHAGLPAVPPRFTGQCCEWLEIRRQVPQFVWTTARPAPCVCEVEVNLNPVALGQRDRSLELIV